MWILSLSHSYANWSFHDRRLRNEVSSNWTRCDDFQWMSMIHEIFYVTVWVTGSTSWLEWHFRLSSFLFLKCFNLTIRLTPSCWFSHSSMQRDTLCFIYVHIFRYPTTAEEKKRKHFRNIRRNEATWNHTLDWMNLNFSNSMKIETWDTTAMDWSRRQRAKNTVRDGENNERHVSGVSSCSECWASMCHDNNLNVFLSSECRRVIRDVCKWIFMVLVDDAMYLEELLVGSFPESEQQNEEKQNAKNNLKLFFLLFFLFFHVHKQKIQQSFLFFYVYKELKFRLNFFCFTRR